LQDKGLKLISLSSHKSFKPKVYNMATRVVNKKFRMDFDHDNVINHIRTLRARFMDMCSFKLSGVGWDEDKKMITLEGESYDRWDKDKVYI